MIDDLAERREARSPWQSRPEKLRPTVGQRTDGSGLFYRGKTHTVIGETEAGKDWLAQIVARDEMTAGKHVLYLDFEDDEDTAIDRLLTLGVDPDVGDARFTHQRLRRPIGDALVTEDDSIWEAVVIDGDLRMPKLHDYDDDLSLIVVAGVTQAMELEGLNPISNSDIATYHRTVLEPLTGLHGDWPAAVVALDHVTKDPSSRGRYALGGAHKLNIVSGASYILENRDPLGIGLTGRSMLKIAKDRPGQLRRLGVKAGALYRYGDLVLVSHDEDSAEGMIEPPGVQDESAELVALKVAITELLHRVGPLPQRDIMAKVSGKSDRKRGALKELIADGYVSKTPHQLLNPYDPETPDDLEK
jgi:hypothetical protein